MKNMTNKENYDNLCRIIINSQKVADTLESIGLNVDSIDNKNGIGDILGKINDDAMKSILVLLNYHADDEDDLYVNVYSSCITEQHDKLDKIWDEYGIK